VKTLREAGEADDDPTAVSLGVANDLALARDYLVSVRRREGLRAVHHEEIAAEVALGEHREDD
jgi:hypothetical protein